MQSYYLMITIRSESDGSCTTFDDVITLDNRTYKEIRDWAFSEAMEKWLREYPQTPSNLFTVQLFQLEPNEFPGVTRLAPGRGRMSDRILP